MSNDQNNINPFPFYESHHLHHSHHHNLTMLSSQGFTFPTIEEDHNNFNPFMYNPQNPNQFHQNPNSISEAPAAAGTSGGSGGCGGGGDNIPVTPNSSASISSQEAAGAEEDSSKREKDIVQTTKANCEEGDGKSKNVKAKEKEGGKKQRQARFAFMTKSEVDNLEDGYRWRKYGQKAVKNSPFPRSYYRCTSQKCSVKKRIERSYQDPSVVITTYEGQHNHHSPAVIRGSAAAMSLFAPPPAFPPNFHQDMFFPSISHANSTNFYTQLSDSGRHHHGHHQPEIPDQYSFLMPGAAIDSSFLHKPEP